MDPRRSIPSGFKKDGVNKEQHLVIFPKEALHYCFDGRAFGKMGKAFASYKAGDTEIKRKIIHSFYPENLLFDGYRHRTTRMNEIVRNTEVITNELGTKKTGQAPNYRTCPVGWYQLESNQRHKDFQSFALPTELWYLR